MKNRYALSRLTVGGIGRSARRSSPAFTTGIFSAIFANLCCGGVHDDALDQHRYVRIRLGDRKSTLAQHLDL
jgi:hypothetical protein